MAILIVDDNPRMRDMIRAVLAPVGEDIHECEDGADALERFQQLKPSWVLMDLAMERMDGLAATRAIRAADPEARVVIVTEHMEPALRRAAEESGASGYVLKEDLSVLLEVIDPGMKPHSALQASELRYRDLFDQMPIGLYRSTPGGQILAANAALAEIAGCAGAEELVGASALQFYVDPADRQRWRRQMEEHGVVRDFDVQLKRRTGEEIWVRHSARVVPDDRGQVRCHEGAIQDVTHERAAESALRASEERYRSYIEQSDEGLWRLELEVPLDVSLRVADQMDHLFRHAYIAECNNAMARMYGYQSANEFVGTRLNRILLRTELHNEQHVLRLIAHGYRLADAETREMDRFGQQKRFLNNLTGIIEEGFLLRIWGAQRDVTERHRLDEALRASEERFRALYDDTPSMYFTVDVRGTVLSANRFGAEYLEYAPEELVGQSVLKVFHEADREAAFDHVAECVCAPGKVFQWELRKTRKGGSNLWVRETARAVRGPEGTVVLIVCEDITDYKRAQEQLRLSQTMAAMGTLVMGVAHEVRNPLHALLGTMDSIEAGADPSPRVRESFGVLREQVGRLRRLMQDLLAFGRPAPLELARQPLAGVLHDAVWQCQRSADTARVQVTSRVSPSLPDVLVDRGRMIQVFTNLIDNAISHAPAGSDVAVTAALSSDEAWIECLVADRGPGFGRADLPRIFDPFFTRRPDGTGLGLSIVQRIVDQHGGQVSAENVPGGGAVIAVRLPVSGRGASGVILT